jgi:phospholipase C
LLTTDRRSFLKFLSRAAAAAAFPRSIDNALAIPAHHRTGTIRDVEHIVFLMQENRAFDHYFHQYQTPSPESRCTRRRAAVPTSRTPASCSTCSSRSAMTCA